MAETKWKAMAMSNISQHLEARTPHRFMENTEVIQ